MSINLAPSETSPRKIVEAVRELAQGRDNASGVVTLTVSTTTTLVSAPNVAPTSHIILSPATADAAAAMNTTYVLQSNVGQGQFIVSHTNTSLNDRSFYWASRG